MDLGRVSGGTGCGDGGWVIRVWYPRVMGPWPPPTPGSPRIPGSTSLPRRPSACSLEGPLWRCPHCSLFKGAPEDTAVPRAAKTVGIWLPTGCGGPGTNPASRPGERSAPGPGTGWKLGLIAPSAQQPTEAGLRSVLPPGDAAPGPSGRVVLFGRDLAPLQLERLGPPAWASSSE